MKIYLITAFDRNQLIGANNQLPWHIPEDLTYFKNVTLNNTIVMGRKTYESIGKPLPNRKNIVISKYLNAIDGITVIQQPDSLLNLTDETVFIIGGASIYEHYLPIANKLYITHIDATFSGDIYFPTINWEEWDLELENVLSPTHQQPYTVRFCVYRRKEDQKLSSS